MPASWAALRRLSRTGRERLRMNGPRELLQSVHDARAVAVQEASVDRVDSPSLDRGQSGETLPLLTLHAPLSRSVAGEDDHLRRASDRGLEAHPRIRVTDIRSHRRAAGQIDELGHETALAGDDERIRPEHV